jgi:hypothetical protein
MEVNNAAIHRGQSGFKEALVGREPARITVPVRGKYLGDIVWLLVRVKVGWAG